MLLKSKLSKNKNSPVRFLELNSNHVLIWSKSFYKELMLLRSAISDSTERLTVSCRFLQEYNSPWNHWPKMSCFQGRSCDLCCEKTSHEKKSNVCFYLSCFLKSCHAHFCSFTSFVMKYTLECSSGFKRETPPRSLFRKKCFGPSVMLLLPFFVR